MGGWVSTGLRVSRVVVFLTAQTLASCAVVGCVYCLCNITYIINISDDVIQIIKTNDLVHKEHSNGFSSVLL